MDETVDEEQGVGWTASLRDRQTPAGLAVLGLGANLGDRAATLGWAARRLGERLGEVVVAPLWASAPISPLPQREFFNTVLVGRHSVVPGAEAAAARDLLAFAKALEREAGRRPGPRHGPRPLDVDLLLLGDLCLASAELTVPHPELHRRAFVVAPLADLLPALRLPPDDRPAAALAIELAARQAVRRLA